MLKSLALLCILVSAVSCDSLGWILAHHVDRSQKFPTSSIVNKFDVRGLFRDVAFIVGYYSEIQELERLGFDADFIRTYDESEQLSVIEFNPQKADTIAASFARYQNMQKSLVQAAFELGLAVVHSNINLISDKTIDWDIDTEVLNLSLERITPGYSMEQSPAYRHLSQLDFNPVISETLEKISSDSLFSFDYHLSESYFTRQSASGEIRLARDWLISVLTGFGLQVTTQKYRSDYAENVCADLIGSEVPEEIVVAGAHYDSRSTDTNNPSLRAPGADDNGSGSSAMLEMARVLSQSNLTFAYTIRICFWTGEEQGLLGSDAYAKKMKAEGAKILAYFNADMLGYKLPNQPITLGMKDRSITEWLLDLSFEITKTYVPELPVKLSSSCCSDYISFFNQGYPAIGYFENGGSASDYPSYHKSNDTVANVNFEQMVLEARAVLAAIMTFALPL